ncbi:MAG: hypothetical protein KIT09_03440 [Bryobacteraceae bacterium]|nr:hypothetical protein [Bryobacteraceae bacterium]
MPLHPDWKEFLQLLNSNGVEYLIVGAHARGFHGIPRYTRDLDIFVRISEGNAAKLERALQAFGFASIGIAADDFLVADRVIQLGVEPYRIDLLTSITGVEFEDAWSDRAASELDGVPVAFLSLRAFRKNKLAAGRPKDLADLADLLESPGA